MSEENEMTLEEVAQELKMSRESVRQTELKALKKLKHRRNSSKWKEIKETMFSLITTKVKD